VNVVQVFCLLFLRFENGWFCVVFVGLIFVEGFVESCFWLLVHSSSGVHSRDAISESCHFVFYGVV